MILIYPTDNSTIKSLSIGSDIIIILGLVYKSFVQLKKTGPETRTKNEKLLQQIR